MALHAITPVPLPMHEQARRDPRHATRASSPARLDFLEAGSVPFPNMVPYRDLERAVRAWIWRHRLPSLQANAPRAFLTHGAPATGKSKSIANVLTALGYRVIVTQATIFAAVHESENIERIEAHMRAAETLAHEGVPVCILFDDIDAIFSLDERTGKSSNNDLARVWLQSICDRKTVYTQSDGAPILFVYSANSMADAHIETYRDGRAVCFHHDPTPVERRRIIDAHLKPRTAWERSICARLARRHPDAQLALFAEVSAAIDAERLDGLLETTTDIARLERELAKPRVLTARVLRIARDLVAARATAFAKPKTGDRA